MPDPKKKTNQPANASTDTRTGGAKQTMKSQIRKAINEGAAAGVGAGANSGMKKTATPINGAKQTMKPYLRKAANEGRQEVASSLAGAVNGANKAQMKQRKTIRPKGSGSTGAQSSNVRGESQTSSMTPAQPVYSQTKRTGAGTSSAQPTQSGVNHFVERPTGGKAGTVGKYSSDGGRGDVGKRSYGEKTATRSTTKLDDFLKGFLYEGVVDRRNTKRK